VGPNRKRNRNRNVVNFPKTAHQAIIQAVGQNFPRLKPIQNAKGDYIRLGSKYHKVGLTQEEELMKYASKGTKPERMLFGWLIEHDIAFSYQVAYFGGRAIPGGAVVDFVIWDLAQPIIIRVQSWWHRDNAVKWADDIQAEKLREMGARVEDVWENELNSVARVDETMRGVLYGQPDKL
jgi:hypothetical protein